MTVEAWLAAAVADAEARGLPELKPLLETLARSTSALRSADPALRQGDSALAGPNPEATRKEPGRP
jgi:hypothetical protein